MSQETVEEIIKDDAEEIIEAAIEKGSLDFKKEELPQSGRAIVNMLRSFNRYLLKDVANDCGDNADYKPVSIILEKIADLHFYYKAFTKFLGNEFLNSSKLLEDPHLKDMWEETEETTRENEKNIMLDLQVRHKDKILQFIKEHPKPVRVAIIQKFNRESYTTN
jgi:hypothetical protein